MNIELIVAAMKAAHTPSMKDEHHVRELWQDGEVTLTKGGDLFRARNLHTIEYPVGKNSIWSKQVALGLSGSFGNVSVYCTSVQCKEIRTMMQLLETNVSRTNKIVTLHKQGVSCVHIASEVNCSVVFVRECLVFVGYSKMK